MNREQSELKESDFLKILWDYFAIHSGQRIQMLNFYIILETFFITAILTLYELDGEYANYQLFLSIAVIFFSFIFWGLDTRTKEMIKLSENALKFIEQKYADSYGSDIMIFSIEQEKTWSQRRLNKLAKRYLSYSKLFLLIYIFFTLIGIFALYTQILLCAN